MESNTAARNALSVPEPLQSVVVNYWQGRALAVAAELELADLLEGGPLDVKTIAEKTKTHAPSLFRLLRALESIGVFQQVSPKMFSNTPASDSGCSAWEFMHREPDHSTLFNLAMRAVGAGMTEAVTAAFDWSRFPTIADIAGGVGTQLVSILDAHRGCQGILFDQPSGLTEVLPHDRMSLVAGDFFQGVPAGADAYILRWIVHDWADPESIRILQNVRKVIPSSGRLVLIEAVLSEDPGFDLAKWMDLNMMVMAGGQERTSAEFAELLAKSGFELEEMVPTSSALSLLVAKPI